MMETQDWRPQLRSAVYRGDGGTVVALLVADPDRADRLEIAIDGRGAFRRFKDVIARWPDEQDRWYAFSDERKRGRARACLAFKGYCVTAPAKPLPKP